MTDPTPADRVRFWRSDNGDYHWTVRAGNHEIIAASTEGYRNRKDAAANYERVTGRTAPDDWQESLG